MCFTKNIRFSFSLISLAWKMFSSADNNILVWKRDRERKKRKVSGPKSKWDPLPIPYVRLIILKIDPSPYSLTREKKRKMKHIYVPYNVPYSRRRSIFVLICVGHFLHGNWSTIYKNNNQYILMVDYLCFFDEKLVTFLFTFNLPP